ncbi:hypothetical protein B0H14DRAFT_3478330 [Mycena olivaceomarginata]|nr:hypothetical protein B0H14DRAFT_3478330 [Mycena olivaceomarginata]
MCEPTKKSTTEPNFWGSSVFLKPTKEETGLASGKKEMDNALILHYKTKSDQLSWNIKAMFKKQAEMAEELWDSEHFEDEILSAFVAQVYTLIQFKPLCL